MIEYKIHKRSELKLYQILEDKKAEFDRVKELNKKAYYQVANGMLCIKDREKWIDPK